MTVYSPYPTACSIAIDLDTLMQYSFNITKCGGVFDMRYDAIATAAAFFVIWLILYSVYKKQVRELNDLQNDFTSEK